MLHDVPENYQDLKGAFLNALQEIEHLREQLRLKQRQRFGPSSESTLHPGMKPLFDEISKEENDDKPQVNKKKLTIKGHERVIVRRELPKGLAREEVYCDLSDEDKVCPCCSESMVKVTEKSSEKLHVKPAVFIVKKFITPVYGCKKCEEVKQARMPFHPIPKCQVSFESLAHIAVCKFADGLPLKRIEGIFAREGIDIKRDRMSRWMIQFSKVLKPIYEALQRRLLSGPCFGIDETTFQTLKEAGRQAHQKSFFIVQAREGPPGQNITLFHYRKSRSKETIAPLIGDFKGQIISDGLGVYDSLFSEYPGIAHGGCWSHARRKFVEAMKGKKSKKDSIAGKMLMHINRLFDIEREIQAKNLAKASHRQQYSKPTVDKIDELLKKSILVVPKKSLTGQALHYLNNQWNRLIAFLTYDLLPIHNNFVERSIRPVAVGRKAFLFADTTDGAECAAILYSLISTAKSNGLNPMTYLCRVTEGLGKGLVLEELLPITKA